jgi:BMFP domain-containing protein YqiC
MQTDNRLLDDIARAASGALGALAGVRAELESQMRALLDGWLKGQNLVTREEFEAVKAMAAKARAENEALAARLTALEAELQAARAEAEDSRPSD